MGKYNSIKKGVDENSENEKEDESQDVVVFFRKEVGETREFVRRINEKKSDNIKNITEQASKAFSKF